jgi:hypothetical protein
MPGDEAESGSPKTVLDFMILGMEWLVERYDKAWLATSPKESVAEKLPFWIRAIVHLFKLEAEALEASRTFLHAALKIVQMADHWSPRARTRPSVSKCGPRPGRSRAGSPLGGSAWAPYGYRRWQRTSRRTFPGRMRSFERWV